MFYLTEHPIQGLMSTTMQSIKEMVDVNTIVGDAVQAADGTVIIPISRVSFGFAAGGGEYSPEQDSSNNMSRKTEEDYEKFPFAGGSGAGVSINPVAFMVVGQEQIKLLPVNINSSVEKILDLVPDIVGKANDSIRRRASARKEAKTETNEEKDVPVEEVEEKETTTRRANCDVSK